MEMSSREWLLLGTLLYGASLAVAWVWQLRPRWRWRWLPLVVLWGAFVTQFHGFFLRGEETHLLPLGNAFELLQMLAWGVVALDGFLRLTFAGRFPVLLTAVVAAAFGGISFANPAWDHAASAAYAGNPWIAVHVVLVVLGYCCLAAQALNAAVFLLQDYSLAHRRFTGVFQLLPPLRQVEQVGGQLLAAGVALLSLGMLIGLVHFFANDLTAGTAVKLVCALAVWAGYLAALVARRKMRLRGGKFARTSLLLFALALLTLWPANAARDGQHKTSETPAATQEP